jgi:hypothetical protein
LKSLIHLPLKLLNGFRFNSDIKVQANPDEISFFGFLAVTSQDKPAWADGSHGSPLSLPSLLPHQLYRHPGEKVNPQDSWTAHPGRKRLRIGFPGFWFRDHGFALNFRIEKVKLLL